MFGPVKKSEPQPDPGPRAPDEHEITLSWVEERFRELGFNDLAAANLAQAGADWHAAEELISSGCSHELAVDILT